MKKKFLSLALALVMILSCVNFSAFSVGAASYETPTIIVDSVSSTDNTTVDVSVLIENNPGVAGAGIRISYDSRLTLLSAESGTGYAFEALDYTTPALKNPCRLNWDSLDQVATENGVIAKLQFSVADGIDAGEILAVSCEYTDGDIYDTNLNDLTFDVVNGGVTIIDYLPGDVNGDLTVNSKDVTVLRRYLAGDDVVINESASNVNGDYQINSKDVTYIRRYLAGYDGYEPHPAPVVHTHIMEATAEKESTCTEKGNIAYWYCSLCDKYFNNENGDGEITLESTVIPAKGHTETVIPDVAPTYDEWGSIGGVKCSVCDTVLIEPTPVKPLERNKLNITYNLWGSDTYLANYLSGVDVSKINTNETELDTTEQGYEIKPIDKYAVPGYVFEGWTDAYGNAVTKIEKGTTGSTTLYATWSKETYTITYDASLKAVPTDVRTKRNIDEVVYLPTKAEMSVDHYIFMGWSDSSGKIIERVEPGTKDIIVHANWTSNRSQVRANDYKSQAPIIIEDEEKQKYHFVYDLGKMINVPIGLIKDYGYISSFGKDETITTKVTFGKENATTKNTAVENATTNSSSWTLSKGWNEITKDATGGEQQISENQSVALSTGESKAYTSTASNYVGGSFHTSNDSLTTSKTITDDSYKLNAEVGASAGYGPFKVEAKVSSEMAHSTNTEDYSENKTHMDNSSEWNMSNSYTASGSTSSNQTLSSSVMKAAKDTWNHEISKSINESESNEKGCSVTNTQSEAYSSSMNIYSINEEEHTVTVHANSSVTPGYYRQVLGGDFYVYGIVTYDVATGAYSVSTQSVLSDTTREYLDYSKDDPLYGDYNNAVLPFEVPIDVHNYIFNSLARTEGVIVDRETGIVTSYEGDAKHVYIPDYAVFPNNDGSVDVVKVVGIENGVFENKDIESVKLGMFIADIPNNAFKNCASLKNVKYNSLNSIGDNAFNGCTSLEEFVLSNNITVLEENAFNGVPSLTANASSAEIAKKVASNTVGSLVLNLNYMSDTLDNSELNVKATEAFTLNAYGASYTNFAINSEAANTVINRVTFANNCKTPMTVNSSNLILNQVKVTDASVVALISKAENIAVSLQGKNSFATTSDNAILTKNMSLALVSGISETTELNVNGKKVLVCTDISDERNLLKQAQIESITADEFNNLLDSHTIIFDANGGTVSEESRVLSYGQSYGELPVPTRENCTFDGWFAESGTQINSDTVFTELSNMVLKAHWTSVWVKADAIPDDARVESEKWTYDLTTNITSDKSEVDGYTLYNTTSKWGETVGPVYSDPSNGSRNVWSEKYVSSTTTHYKYYHRTNGSLWGTDATAPGWARHPIDITYPLTAGYYSAEYGIQYYKTYYCSSCGNDHMWIPDGTYVENHYSNRWYYQEPVYTYYHTKTEALESDTEITESDTISNVQKWVKFTVK